LEELDRDGEELREGLGGGNIAPRGGGTMEAWLEDIYGAG